MAKVIVGMSGGVDSAVCAYLLKAAGYEVIGVTLKTWVAADGKESRCCEIDDARQTADQIGIPYYAVNCITEFHHCVISPFIDAYIQGLTPNPCIGCNRDIKWAKMLDFAKSMQAEYIATGHYASVIRLDNGRYTVQKASHIEKDQTYMLYKLTQEQLAATLMPLGKLSKDQDPRVAQHPHELIIYGGNGGCFQNWAQYRLTMQYLANMTEEQTLPMYSGHPLGLFPSHKDAPRVVITNGMVIPNYSSQDNWERFNAMGVSQYGQMTAGSWMYIGPQGIVHGTTITVMNAARKQLRKRGLKGTEEERHGMLFVTAGLGGMSGSYI